MLDAVRCENDTWGVARTKKAIATIPAWAKRLTAARVLVTENQTEFATSIGLSQQRYSNYELGRREPTILIWGLIRQKLNVTIDFIFFGHADSASRTAGAIKSGRAPVGAAIGRRRA